MFCISFHFLMLHRFEIHSALKLSRTALLCCRLFARLLIGNKSRKLGLEQKRGMKLGKREKSPPVPSPFPLQSSSFFRFRSNFLACVAQALSPPQRLQLGGGKGLSSFFPLPIVPRALSFSFSPASPQHKEASAEERGTGYNFRGLS